MKKLLIGIICGLIFLPLAAWGQKWIPPYTDSDGTFVEGHWQTPEERQKEQSSTPGKVNPYSGQFTPYRGGSEAQQPPLRMPVTPYPHLNPYYPQPDYRYPGR